MTEEQRQEKKMAPAYQKYAFAEAAMTMEDANMARTALDQVRWGSDMKTYIEKANAFRTEAGIREAAEIYAVESQMARNAAKVSELKDFYSRGLDFLSDEGKAKVNHLYSTMGDTTLGEIIDSYKQAASTVKLAESEALKGRFKPEELEAAKKNVEKYETFVNFYQASHGQKIGHLRRTTEDKFEKKTIESLVMELPEAPKPKPKEEEKTE